CAKGSPYSSGSGYTLDSW
nr:immunoglobulin heavy chain junction region [Macaca mulatta]